ncbi:MAG: RimK family alpha-L-glutamate ligase [Gemmatimonadales bacterium]|jgi:RimK family alpha-L-glutamate ligase
MHVAILSARKGWHTDQLCRAISARGATAELLAYEGLIARLGTAGHASEPANAAASGAAASGAVVSAPFAIGADVVLARIIPAGSLEQIIYRVDALHWLEDAGVRVVNSPRAIERSVDKFYTSALLQMAGLATPETVVCERSEDAIAAFRTMGDAIVKPLFGSMGLGMVRVHDEEIAWRVFRALDAIRGVYYLQRTIDHGGRDIRAFVVGDRVIGAIERRSSDTGPQWRTNYSRGGAVRALTLSPAWAELAVRAARAVGADYAGVDLLPAEDGTVYALEVNAIPGWRGLQEATGIDVADELARLAVGG